MVRETSKQSYKKITDLGDRQQTVFKGLKSIEPATDREVAAHIGMPVHHVSARRAELLTFGFAVEHGRKFDKQTRRKVTSWVTSDPFSQSKINQVVGKEKPQKNQVKKYSLTMHSGKKFIITQHMKDEIEEALKVKRSGNETIKISTQVFVLSNIKLPIVDLAAATVESPAGPVEETYPITIIKDGDQWVETLKSERDLKKDKITFRVVRKGKGSQRVYSDIMTYFDDQGYEIFRDVKGYKV